ncbi:hypothetical protein Efla_002679 [Eimeria flavescens]
MAVWRFGSRSWRALRVYFLFLFFSCLLFAAVYGQPSSSDSAPFGKPGEVCRATLYPKGNPLLEHQPAAALRGSEGKEAKSTPVAHPSFFVRSSRHIAEHDFDVVEYVHKKTGITVWSFQTQPSEEEMVFSICFRTPVTDSYGTPHVLEHAVLEGSVKYPVHSVFTQLGKRSLNTYLNASTWPDRTCFPAASLNPKDLFNLSSVYIDAVFFPLAVRDPRILAQEGWRYVLSPQAKDQSDVDCGETPDACKLEYSGVVMSEMKGVWADPEEAESRYLLRELFPDVATYVEDSGGIPEVMSGLDFEHLKKFHKALYTPQNAWITFYGPDDVQARLQFVDDYFSDPRWDNFQKEDREIRIQHQVAFQAPKYAEYPFASSASTLTDIVVVAWALNPCISSSPSSCVDFDGFTRTAFHVLSHLLMGNKTSPLYKALVDSKLGKSISDPVLWFDVKHPVFGVELKGVEQRDGAAADMEVVVLQTLSTLAVSGFSADEIADALNSVEFTWREMPREHGQPRGVKFSRLMNDQINYHRDPYMGLMFEADFKAIRKALGRGEKVFEDLINKYLLGNQHRVTLRMKASRTHAAEMEKRERQQLEAVKAKMSKEELRGLLKLQQELKLLQVCLLPLQPKSLSLLMRLLLHPFAAFSFVGEEIPLEVNAVGSVPLVTHEISTSGLVYVEVALSLADLRVDDIYYLPLLTRMLESAGTTELPAGKLLPLIGRTTGGIKASYEFRQNPQNPLAVPHPFDATGVLSPCRLFLQAAKHQSVDLWCLLHAMLVDTDFGNSSFGEEMIKKLITDREDQLRRLAFISARRTAEGSFAAASHMQELAEGYPSLLFFRDLLKQAESDWSVVAARLSSLMRVLLHRKNIAFNVTGDAASLRLSTEGPSRQAMLHFIEALPGGPEQDVTAEAEAFFKPQAFGREPRWAAEAEKRQLLEGEKKEAYIIPTQVSDLCLTVRLQAPGDPVVGADRVGASVLDNTFLMSHVRENLGAYGAWLRVNGGGLASFMTLRDPKLPLSIKAIRTTPSVAETWSRQAKADELLEAILPTVGLLDMPLSAEGKGRKSFWQWVIGESAAHRMQFRQEIINTTAEDVQAFSQKLRLALETSRQAVVMVGPQHTAEEVVQEGDELKFIHVE